MRGVSYLHFIIVYPQIYRVVGSAELPAAVQTDLQLLAAAEPAAVRATKRIVSQALEGSLTATLDSAAREFAGLLRHGAAREGLAAQRQKRAAAWQVAVPALPDFT